MILSIINWKGGVGKTTTTLNLGYNLSAMGFKVLLVDLDGQANLTGGIPGGNKCDKHLPDVFIDEDLDLPIFKSPWENVDYIPNVRSKALKGGKHLVVDDDGNLRLRMKLNEIKDSYDFIVIDCPPEHSPTTINALIASDRLIVPSMMDKDSIGGLRDLQKEIEKIHNKGWNENLELSGVVVYRPKMNTNYAQVAREYLDSIYNGYIYKTVIRENVKVTEAKASKKPIALYNQEAAAYFDFKSLTEEFLKHEGVLAYE